MSWIEWLIGIVSAFEGSYKWYVIGGAISVMALIFSRLVFKTLKWIFILIGLLVIVAAFLVQFGYFESN
jgi:hypothetical protein